MPRYFFHIDDGHSSRDSDGYDLLDLETAKCEAIEMAGSIICEAGATFWDRGEWGMTVADSAGLTLFNLQLVGTEAPSIRRHVSPTASVA
jgi:hypothetical protein